ncbi:MAG: YbaK/EbsC family protein [bacterium]|nr:YbaK/EbsC family protein [bacterium]
MKGQNIKNFLDSNNIPYTSIHHSLAYSAQRTAHVAHIPGKELAKTVVLRINGKMTMAVMTANQRVNPNLLRKIFETEEIELATEADLMALFPDCELGAMPPFGQLYGMDEFVSESLSKDDEICFNAGTHTELIKMKYRDFEKLVNPKIINFKARL